MLDRGLEPVAVHDDVERPVAALGALRRLLRVEREPRLQLLAGGARVDEHVAAGAADVRDLCGNKILRRVRIIASTSTPSTRRLLDGVAMWASHRSLSQHGRGHPTHWSISTQATTSRPWTACAVPSGPT